MLNRADLNLRIALTHAGEDDVGQGVAHPVVLGRPQTGRGEGREAERNLTPRHVGPLGGQVEQQRHPVLLGGRPQWLVHGVAVRLSRQRCDRDEGPSQAQLGTPLEFRPSRPRIIDIDHADAPQPPGLGPTEVGDPAVIGVTNPGQQLAVFQVVPEQALAGLQHRAPNPVHLKLGQHGLGLIGALSDIFPNADKIQAAGVLKATPGLGDGAERGDLHIAEEPRVGLFAVLGRIAFDRRRPVQQPGRHALGVQVGGLHNMRITRNHRRLAHASLLISLQRPYHAPGRDTRKGRPRLHSGPFWAT